MRSLSRMCVWPGSGPAVSARSSPQRRLLQDEAAAGDAVPAADGTAEGTTAAGGSIAPPPPPLTVTLFTASGLAEQLAANGTIATIFAPNDTVSTVTCIMRHASCPLGHGSWRMQQGQQRRRSCELHRRQAVQPCSLQAAAIFGPH